MPRASPPSPASPLRWRRARAGRAPPSPAPPPPGARPGPAQRPPHVRVSLAEVMQWVNWKAASGAAAGGTPPGREGKGSEFQIVPCRDGHVAVVYTVTQWPATRALIGDKRLEDAKFATRAGRRKHIAELYDILTPWFAGKTRAEIQKAAQSKGVPFR